MTIMTTLHEDPELDKWWAMQDREWLDEALVTEKDRRGRRILGAIQATPSGQGRFSMLFGVREGISADEEHRVAIECWNRNLDLVERGRESCAYHWMESNGVLWVQLIDFSEFEHE
ncbi:MAG TPA: hypothetical protein DEG88_06000 [Propionibacteriaceae bacterium]|mgnify:CR=1 FL=1|nr:hypothetical protein [Micropruina sp.]HBX81683.1 hypothetical protein [Propionibacteriaceae bacterium]HBY22842.1 hypothetical protein [Propionibacteriaceae bacterium]